MNTKQYEASFQLIGQNVKNLSVENTIVAIDDDDDLEKEFSINVGTFQIENHDESGYKVGSIEIYIETIIKEKTTDDKKPDIFELKMSIDGIFTDYIEVSDESFEKKLKINGVAALFSIARGFITNVSAQVLARGKVVLPLVNFNEISKSQSE